MRVCKHARLDMCSDCEIQFMSFKGAGVARLSSVSAAACILFQVSDRIDAFLYSVEHLSRFNPGVVKHALATPTGSALPFTGRDFGVWFTPKDSEPQLR